MLLTAQRFESPSGIQGVNAFRYSHPGGYGRVAELDDLAGKARLEQQELEVLPGGNKVRSYLDVFAPDSVPLSSAIEWAASVLLEVPPSSLPLVVESADLALRFSAERTLAADWPMEARDLLRSLALLAAMRTGQRT